LSFCNYCKRDGHITKECPIRPLKKHAIAFNASVDSSVASSSFDTTNVQLHTPALIQTLTLEIIQQMIISASSTLGLLGKPFSTSFPWYFESGAFNHMNNNVVNLTNVTTYSGNLQIHIVVGNHLPIIAMGDISSSLTGVFVSSSLSSNLISIGQLVENDCRVEFSRYGYLEQDQHSKTMIVKGSKVGHLIPLSFVKSPCSFLPFISCNSVIVNFEICISILDIQSQMYFMIC